MKKEILFSLALITMLLSACIFNESQKGEVIEQVSSLAEVQEFLTKYPDAEIRANLLGRAVIEDNIDNLRYYCGQQMEVKSYWDVMIEENEKGLEIWVDEEDTEKITFVTP